MLPWLTTAQSCESVCSLTCCLLETVCEHMGSTKCARNPPPPNLQPHRCHLSLIHSYSSHQPVYSLCHRGCSVDMEGKIINFASGLRQTNSSKNNSLHRLNFHPCLCVVGTPERQFHKTLRGCSMQPQSANYKRSKHAGDKQVPSALGLRGENKQNENIQSEDQVTQHWLYMCRADLRQLKAATGIRRGFVQIHFRLSKRVW